MVKQYIKHLIVLLSLCIGLQQGNEIFAQIPSDFSITVETKPSICLKDGEVKANVWKITGTPQYKYTLLYDLLDSQGNSVTNLGQFTTTNLFGNLAPGLYSLQVKVEVLKVNGEVYEFFLPSQDVEITSTYKIPAVKPIIARKPLKGYSENGVQKGTGILLFAFLKEQGLGPYYARIIEAPATYTGTKDWVEASVRGGYSYNPEPPFYDLYEYELVYSAYHTVFMDIAEGTYKIEYKDACNNTEVRIVNVEASDNCYAGGDYTHDKDYDFRAYRTGKNCGWLYMLDTSIYNAERAKYFQYAWQTPDEEAAGLPKEWHDFETTPWKELVLDDSKGYASVWNQRGNAKWSYVFYKIKDGLSFAEASKNKNKYLPNLFFRIKGSPYASNNVIRTKKVLSGYAVDHERDSYDYCLDSYNVTFTISRNGTSECFPITVEILSEGKVVETFLLTSWDQVETREFLTTKAYKVRVKNKFGTILQESSDRQYIKRPEAGKVELRTYGGSKEDFKCDYYNQPIHIWRNGVVCKENVTIEVFEEGTLVKTTKETNFKYKAKYGKHYKIRLTDHIKNDQVQEKTVFFEKKPQRFEIGFFKKCRTFCSDVQWGVFQLTRTWEQDLNSSPFEGGTISLVKAPAGYDPIDGAMKVGEVYNISDFPTVEAYSGDVQLNLMQRSSIDRYKYLLSIGQFSRLWNNLDINFEVTAETAGEYIFEFVDECGNKHTLSDKIEYMPPKAITTDYSFFRPLIESPKCGTIRIYPYYYGTPENALSLGGTPVPNIVLAIVGRSNLPESVRQEEVSTNIPAWKFPRWSSYCFLDPSPTALNGVDPKDAYIEMPLTSGTLRFNVGVKDSYNKLTAKGDYKNFQEECLPLLEVPITKLPLTYNRETYVGYACPEREVGFLHINPVNNAGDVRIRIFTKDGKKIIEEEGVTTEDGVDFYIQDYLENGELVAGEYNMEIYDSSCESINTEKLIIYSLANPVLFGSGQTQRKYCEGDEIVLKAINLGKNATYKWTLPNGEERTGRVVSIKNATAASSGIYKLKATNELCANAKEVEFSFPISIAPPELWWRKDAIDADWNNMLNWAKADGTPVSAVPAKCTNVHIPSTVDSFFPNISATKKSEYGEAECYNLYLHYGSKVGTPQSLLYHRAYVDYNFGIMGQSGEVTAFEHTGHPTADKKMLKRDRWYMLATPIKDVCAGDFSLAGYPMTYCRNIQSTQVSAISDVTFERSFNTLSRKFLEGDYNVRNAFMLKVAPLEAGRVGYDNHKHLNALNGILRLPNFEEVNKHYSIFPLQHYYAREGKSKMYYFREKDLRPLNRSEEIRRTEASFRFIFEQQALKEEDFNNTHIGTILVNGKTVQGYSYPAVYSGSSTILIGNPFMTPIDFDKLYKANETKIEPYYYIFEDNQWKVYEVNNPAVSTLSKEIQPLQSILIFFKEGQSYNEINFPTFDDMSVLLSPNDTKDLVPRSSTGSCNCKLPLKVQLTTELGRSSSAYLSWDSQQHSVPAVMNSSFVEQATIFIVNPESGKGNYLQASETTYDAYPIGIYYSLGGTIKLSFENIDRKEYESLVLLDLVEDKEINLLEENSYSYLSLASGESNRFVLKVQRRGVTSQKSPLDNSASKVTIAQSKDAIILHSTEDMKLIEIYDMTGIRVLKKEDFTNARNCILHLDPSKSYVVEVVLNNGVRKKFKIQM